MRSSSSNLTSNGQALSRTRPRDFYLAYFYQHHLARPPAALIKDDLLLISMQALGAASLALKVSGQAVENEALKLYLNAVKQLNLALQSPNDATKDSTLISVLILGFYEMTLGSDWHSMQQWASHVRGTVALLELRGPDQMRTTNGRVLFLQISAAISLECARHSARIPEVIHTMIAECAGYIEDRQDPLWLAQTASFQAMDLFSDVMSGRVTDPAFMLAAAEECDQRLRMVFADTTPMWFFEVVSSPELNEYPSFTPYFHMYSCSLAAQIWNSVRSLRILMQQIMIWALSKHMNCEPVTVKAQARIESCKDVSKQMQMDILATIQQHMNAMSPDPNRSPAFFTRATQYPSPSGYEGISTAINFRETDVVLQTSKGYHLLWSLTTVARFGDETLGPAAIDLLQVVGDRLGIRQGHALKAAFTRYKSYRPAGPWRRHDGTRIYAAFTLPST